MQRALYILQHFETDELIKTLAKMENLNTENTPLCGTEMRDLIFRACILDELETRGLPNLPLR